MVYPEIVSESMVSALDFTFPVARAYTESPSIDVFTGRMVRAIPLLAIAATLFISALSSFALVTIQAIVVFKENRLAKERLLSLLFYKDSDGNFPFRIINEKLTVEKIKISQI